MDQAGKDVKRTEYRFRCNLRPSHQPQRERGRPGQGQAGKCMGTPATSRANNEKTGFDREDQLCVSGTWPRTWFVLSKTQVGYFFKSFYCVHFVWEVMVWVSVSEYVCRGQRAAPGSRFSPFPVWVPGIELGSSGLAASTLPTEPSRWLHQIRVRLQQLMATSSL